MRILGIDPGIAITGWAILDFDKAMTLVDFGVIETLKGVPHGERLCELNNDLSEIIKQFKPDYAGIEALLFNNNAKTAMHVSEARGVILFTLQKSNIPVMQCTPPQVKSSIAGSGRATKLQVQENVKRLCGLKSIPKPDDAADAIAVGICAHDLYVMDNLMKDKV